ncbi:hypothetical protein F2Q69_00020765 [Brassica cretica]|uniref:Replication protein A 70 kDa DNA-binding subunit B/D first OB fold domain-containing protein n=1 Tax=Brassica cretica TaxID=69181 RepID=A0A8S9QDA9_BRACR|nr:hypothetical protein F2Q69_00020765 [Brassica cretica]
MAAITDVCDLKPFKSMWKIRVKILRLWKQYSTAGGLTIEIVLIDSNGVKIKVSVKKDLVNQFDAFLSQGSSKILINFSLNPSCGSYRTTIHPYKIGFLSTTRVRCCDALPDELTGFEPVNYRDILDGSLNTDYLVGQIVEVTPIEVVLANGKDTKKITVELLKKKTTEHKYTIKFNESTLFRKIQPVNGSNFLCCANFRGIKRGRYHPMYCIDLCGALVRVGDLIATKLAQPANIYNSILYSLEFSLINLGYTHIQCVSYGALARRLNAFWRSNTADVLVCVSSGFNYITNMEDGSDILFDSDIPEIQFFKSQ